MQDQWWRGPQNRAWAACMPAPNCQALIWRWRVNDYGSKVKGTTMYRREHHFPDVCAGVMH